MTEKAKRLRTRSLLLALVLIGGCAAKPDNSYSLYRNSPLDLSERVRFATFDAKESDDFNGGNCRMAARLLNANVIAANKALGKPPIEGAGFWCERGTYTHSGTVPKKFESSFPADSDSPLKW